MSLPSASLTAAGLSNRPVLFLDTCLLLDTIRDITRDRMSKEEAQANLTLLAQAAGGHIAAFVTDTVLREIGDHRQKAMDECEAAIGKFTVLAGKVHGIAAAFGGAGTLDISDLATHVSRADQRLTDWLTTASEIVADHAVERRAYQRSMKPLAPARKGSNSLADCTIIETYFEAADALRRAGHKAPIVFASSNIKDYRQDGSNQLHPELQGDFAKVRMDYAHTFQLAKHLLK